MELYLRANYAERVQERTTGELLAKEKHQLEARSEQLELGLTLTLTLTLTLSLTLTLTLTRRVTSSCAQRRRG